MISQWSFYLDEEKHGVYIGDRNEGRFISSMRFPGSVSSNESLSKNEQEFLRHASVSIEASTDCYVSGVKFNSEDLYIWCLSDICSHDIARRFCKSEEEHSIVFIPDLWRMFFAISYAMRDYAVPLGIGKIIYVDGEYNF